MRLFVLGAACSGKTTIAVCLRDHGVPVVDTDDEIVRLNGGAWPDIATKNQQLLPLVLESAAALPEVILLNSYMPLDETQRLRDQGFKVVLLDVSERELRRRHAVRLAKQGWTNIEWLQWNQSVIQQHVEAGVVDHVVDGERDVTNVAADLVALIRPGP